VVAVYLDFRKAFGSVSQDILSRLGCYDLSVRTTGWVKTGWMIRLREWWCCLTGILYLEACDKWSTIRVYTEERLSELDLFRQKRSQGGL